MRKMKYDLKQFEERRKKLGALIDGSALILASHPEHVRNGDVHHPYRQDSNFFYLTGFEEPGSVFVFRPGKSPETILFVRKKDPSKETWEGFRYGTQLAKEVFGVDEAYCIEDFEEKAPELLKDVVDVYYSLFHNQQFDLRIQKVFETVKSNSGRSGKGNLNIKDSYPLIGELRVHKSAYEMETMLRACEISAEAHAEVMKNIKPGMNEREINGLFLYEIMKRGAAREGYGSIVATGNNATTLHYVFNDQNLGENDMLLIDAGAEYNYYTGDITRTFPVSGRFNDAQKRLYQGVLTLQKSLIEDVRPGASIKALQEKAIDHLVDIMIEEKLLKGSKAEILENKTFKQFYPHNLGHWLGSDVHDAGAYEVNKEPRPFEPGMCLTIEPGLYIPKDAPDVPDELRGIGIRIEDNILVTPEGHENMTTKAPKEVDELESIIGSA